jgi:7-cyano-7-deazaguanine synthase in queuosine biosynthesis
MANKIVTYSAGLDSTTSLLLALERFKRSTLVPIYIVRRGWPVSREKAVVQRVCKKLGIKPSLIDGSKYNYGKKTENRNFIFLQKILPAVARRYKANVILWGEEETFGYTNFYLQNRQDLHPEFLLKINRWYEKKGYPFRAVTIIGDIGKLSMFSDLMCLYKKYRLDPVFDTYTCWYVGKGGKECGKCEHCILKYCSLRKAGYSIRESVDCFASDPRTSKIMSKTHKELTKVFNKGIFERYEKKLSKKIKYVQVIDKFLKRELGGLTNG